MFVDPKRFADSQLGSPVKTAGLGGYWAYVPKPLPRALELDSQTVMLLSKADRAVGRLAGAGRLLPNPHLLIQPYVTREALASSRIEGTQASLSDVFDARARQSAEGPIREVTNYIGALEFGLSALARLPISRRLLCGAHEVLMRDARGQERLPGEVRRSQNWIGSPDNRPDTAVFVPPPVVEMEQAFSELEKFLHGPTSLPPLVEIAMIHYQFETIHPFLDGNGRLGRLLIAYLLIEKELLPQPLLYLSAYFELRRSDYYDNLQRVRETGDLGGWLDFFLVGVAEQSTDAINRAEALADLREGYRSRFRGDRSRAIEVVDLVFENPILVTSHVATRLGITLQNALTHLRKLQGYGIIEEVKGVPGRSKRWRAVEVLHALDPEFDSATGPRC